MTPGWLEIVSYVAIILAVFCSLAIVADMLARCGQKMWIMNLVWPITALYLGPVGLWAYWMLGRSNPRKAGHELPSGGDHAGDHKPFWRTVLVATSHCGAGCAIGDVVGESAIFLVGFTLFSSKLLTAYAVDFALAYGLGIVFQYFTIAPMRNLGVRDGLMAAAKADTISLVAFEVGMFAWMALNRLVFFATPPEPNTATFWFLMQVAMIVGFATSYPANWWLVKRGLKEAM